MTVMSVLDSFRLDDKVVIVTGASSGLGVSFAQACAEAGADLVLAARRVDKLQQTCELVRAAGRPLGPLGEPGQAVDNVSAAEFVLTALRETEAG